jgi:hypothetical protein
MWLSLVSLASFGLGVLFGRDLARLLRSFRVRRALAGFSFLLLWSFMFLAIVRNYSGAFWYGDWLEHFQRTLFFLHHFPVNSPIIMGYQLPARPPAMNVLAAFFMGQTRDSFEIFQVVFCFLNLLMFLPCCLIMPALVGPRRTSVWPLVAVFCLNPMVMQNVTYTWTKAFTAFYVVLGLWFYLAAWRKNDRLRMSVAFLSLSMGILVHYSAAPYVLFLTLHYLFRVFKTRAGRWKEVAMIAGACGMLLATWFGWSTAVYGGRSTVASNTTVTSSQQYQGDNVVKIAANLFDSIVPAVVRNHSYLDASGHQGFLGSLRDNAFIFYQTNLVFSMGLIGGPIVLWLIYRLLREPAKSNPMRSFWLAMISFSVVVGVASVGERDPLGVAHLTLLSMEILGLSLLAGMFPFRRILLALVIAGCLLDFSFGVLLQAHVESLENTSKRKIFPSLVEVMAQKQPETTADSLSESAWNNWILKHQYAQLVELSESHNVDAAVGRGQVQKWSENDQKFWHGWYARNNGAVGFLGDRLAGKSAAFTTILESVMIALALWLAVFMLQVSSAGRGASAVSALNFRVVREGWRSEKPNGAN